MVPNSSSGCGPIPNRQHKKSKNGCLQCKQRKVKCDERRPFCLNCSKHFRNMDKCDFPAAANGYMTSRDYVSAARPRNTANKPKSIRKSPLVDLLRSPGSGIDPFKSCPGSNIPDAELFMHHYFSNFRSKSFPMALGYQEKPFLQTWWSMASESPAMFNATLQLSAFDLEVTQGDKGTQRSKLLLNKECISLLRKRVEDPILGVSDETIGSVLVLTIVEFERGNLRMVKMHVEGLKRMVNIRGGLDAIRATNPVLTNLIFGITMTVMTEPQFFSPTKWQPLEDMPDYSNTSSLFQYEDVGVSSTLACAIRELRVMTNNFTNPEYIGWPAKPTPTLCSNILIRLLSIPIPRDQGPYVSCVSECMRLAAVMLCFLPFKNDYPSPELMINVQLHKLKANLETMLEIGQQDHPLLPWILISGGIFAQQPERGWFIGQILSVSSDLGIYSWGEMLKHLLSVIYIEYFCEIPFRQLWEEVVQKRLELDLVDLDPW
ncbi:hypothetical protein IFR05_012821 [Cadophora sp. M221]|nr:hypothetical protein IFR05_012821 [Cadophora sp. M221]